MQGSVRDLRRLIPEILESVESVTAERNLVVFMRGNNRGERSSFRGACAAGEKSRA